MTVHYQSLASEFLFCNSEKNNIEKTCSWVLWNENYFQFNGKSYSQISRDSFENIVVRFMQRHKEFERRPLRSSDLNNLILNIRASISTSDRIEPPAVLNRENQQRHSDYISLDNGIFELDSLEKKAFQEIELKTHEPKYFTLAHLPFAFDKNSESPIWDKFLFETLPQRETRDFLQEWFGYNLVFDNSMAKFVILSGEGANGKSVICKVLRTLVGKNNTSSVQIESVRPERTFPLQATIGKLSNIVDELGTIDRASEALIKNITGGGEISIDRKHQTPIQIEPTIRLTFATNSLPRISDRSDGLWRRLILIPFANQILDETKQNKRFTETEYWIKSGEMSGILNWALDGLRRLKIRGHFIEPECSIKAKSTYKLHSNPAKDFLLNNCIAKTDKEISSDALYQKYRSYCKRNGISPLPANIFGKEVGKAFPSAAPSKNAKKINGIRGRVWHGISFMEIESAQLTQQTR